MSTTESVRLSVPLPRRAAGIGIPLTDDGLARLAERLVFLQDVALPELRPLLTARERDERDVATFERFLAEAQWLESVLGRASELPPPDVDAVGIGSRVQLATPDGEHTWVRPVHPVEAALDDERISMTSPVSQAILGARVGDVVVVNGPAGEWVCEIVEIHDGDSIAEPTRH
jgi:transcription elongation factor GreA